MRVIGGDLRGRKLLAPRGRATRPTADRVRESLFNVLAPIIADADVLDLFAGSGSLGIEALSRGAGTAVFVEADRAAVRVLRQNIAALGLTERAEVRPTSVAAALQQLAGAGREFDVILLDPPYQQDLAATVLGQLAASPLLRSGATVVAEHDRRRTPPDRLGAGDASLVRIRTLAYGDIALSLYRRPERQARVAAEEEDE